MSPAGFSIGLNRIGGGRGLEIEPVTSVTIPDSRFDNHNKPAARHTIYNIGGDKFTAITVPATDQNDTCSATTHIQQERDGNVIDAHLVQGNEVGYSEFELLGGDTLVVRSQRTEGITI